MQKEWLLQGEFSPEQRQQIKALTERLKCPRLVAELLFRKGLDTPDQIEDFFQPQLGISMILSSFRTWARPWTAS